MELERNTGKRVYQTEVIAQRPMNPQEPKISFYAKRSFPEKINATFEFIHENWKVLLKYSTYLLLPLCLIQAIPVNTVTSLTYTDMANYWFAYGVILLLGLAAGILSVAIVYTLMAKYNEREERLTGITFAGLKPELLKRVKRGLLMIPFAIVVLSLAGGVITLLGMASRYTLLVSLPLCIAATIPLLLFTPAYLFEDTGIVRAFAKSFRWGFATWLGVFFVFLTMEVVSMVASSVASLPWIVSSVVKYIFLLSDTPEETALSTGFSLMHYVFCVIMMFGSYLSGICVTVGLAYQYAHAREKTESVSVAGDMNNVEQL
jgi:MFS family permease